MHKIFEKASEIEIKMFINKILAFALFKLFCHLVVSYSSTLKYLQECEILVPNRLC